MGKSKRDYCACETCGGLGYEPMNLEIGSADIALRRIRFLRNMMRESLAALSWEKEKSSRVQLVEALLNKALESDGKDGPVE